MTDTLTILCPVTSRNCGHDRAQQPLMHALLPSMDALQMWGGVRLIVGYDDDDPVWSIHKVRTDIDRPIQWIQLKGRTGQITAIWNYLECSLGSWEYLLPANDDLAFQTSPLPAIDVLKERNGFGIVGFHDHAFPGLATFYVVGRMHRQIFGTLYPLPWQGAHQDSWIADVYRPWGASEVDQRFQVHNHTGPTGFPMIGPRFEYGEPADYRQVVLDGRRKVNDWLKGHPGVAPVLTDEGLREARTII